jgi:hypothetical protein
MFHDGDLQSGIALAIQQSKSVACFVRGLQNRISIVSRKPRPEHMQMQTKKALCGRNNGL